MIDHKARNAQYCSATTRFFKERGKDLPAALSSKMAAGTATTVDCTSAIVECFTIAAMSDFTALVQQGAQAVQAGVVEPVPEPELPFDKGEESPSDSLDDDELDEAFKEATGDY